MLPWVVTLLLVLSQFAQTDMGELRLRVTDPDGLALEATVDIVSAAAQVRERLRTDPTGVLVARRLTFGTYRVDVSRDGFAPSSTIVEIRSALPTDVHVVLGLAPVQAQVDVAADATLLDRGRTSAEQRIGSETLQRRMTALPGRSIPDLINTQPGWLLEANGVLHPRGSEYQTQYVVDGLPLTDNRSPAFAPAIETDDVHAMRIMTGGFPAEYGRKLGGVIEVVTAGPSERGFHGAGSASTGSFGTAAADGLGSFGWSRATLSVSGGGATTNRYLDPPVEENFTNHGTTGRASARLDVDVSDADRAGDRPVRHVTIPGAERTAAGGGGSAAGSRRVGARRRVLVSASVRRAARR